MVEGGGGGEKAKGVKKIVVKNCITHADFLICLRSGKNQMITMNSFRSEKHDIFTQKINKIALSADDDKRFVLEDGVHTLAWGHWRLREK